MAPIVAVAIAAGVWLFAPKPSEVIGSYKSSDPAPAIEAKADRVEDARLALDYWMKACHDAVARADQLQARIDAAQADRETAKDTVIRNAQENNQIVLDILRSIPPEERTPKTILATLFAAKTDAGLSGLLGELSPARQLELAQLWKALLDEDERIRAEAQAKVDAMDAEREAALRDKARAEGEIGALRTTLADQKSAVADAQARERVASETLRTRTEELRAQIGAQTSRAVRDVWFWRLWLFGLVGLIFFCGRVMPTAARFWPWLAPLNKFNAFVFRVISGQEIK